MTTCVAVGGLGLNYGHIWKHSRTIGVFELRTSTGSCTFPSLERFKAIAFVTSNHRHKNKSFLDKTENILLPVAVRGSKTSVLNICKNKFICARVSRKQLRARKYHPNEGLCKHAHARARAQVNGFFPKCACLRRSYETFFDRKFLDLCSVFDILKYTSIFKICKTDFVDIMSLIYKKRSYRFLF